ncbi:MAG: aldehyde dehydrogenase family protein, partial [Burkholderiales bacterium]|nr:aldehyde dehydrogenase family protein [Anaerolineae bacterium]
INVDHSMRVMQEETFGPLVPVMRVRDADEAVQLANDNEYGLSGAIFSRDLKRAEQLATRIDSGDIAVNRTHVVFGTPDAPMGGQKHSGVGRRGGPEGLRRFVSTQTVITDRLWATPPGLALLDSFTLKALFTLRMLRRWLPFL